MLMEIQFDFKCNCLWFLVKKILNFIPAYDPKVQNPAV